MSYDSRTLPASLPALDHTQIDTLTLLDHRGVDWSRVERTVYLIHQRLRYEYPGPIDDLDHCLMIVPPERHGDQRRLAYRLVVSDAGAETTCGQDDFGNLVLEVRAARVDRSIDFEAWIAVERRRDHGQRRIHTASLADPRWLQPSSLTQPNAALRQAAAGQAATGARGLDLADLINERVHRAIRYASGVTGIRTTAARALALGRGVCQDYAHVMLAICRLCGLPARYVSGHLLGEGGTHAWVEVLLPAPEAPGETVAIPFDPTHGRRAGLSYLTVAVGRDYLDVPPTSGTFRASYRGHLSARKRVGLTEVHYACEDARSEQSYA